MANLKAIERRLNNLLELTKEQLPNEDGWGRTYSLGFIAALEQMQNIIKEYK